MSQSLFNLIKKLDQNEKRYFKTFSSMYSKSKKNNYIKLFDAIDRQKQYNEELIKKKFINEKFTRQLSVTKNYLYRLILKSMRLYNEGKSEELKIIASILDAKFLISKSMYKESYKILTRARESAVKKEKNLLVLEASYLIRSLQGKPGIGYSGKDCKDIHKVQIDELGKYRNICDFLYLEGFLKSIIIKKHSLVTKEDERFYYSLFKNRLMQDEQQALTKQAKFLYYYIKIHTSWVQSDFITYYKSCRGIVAMIESMEHNNEIDIIDNIKYLRNLIIASQICAFPHKSLHYLSIMKFIPQKFKLPKNHHVAIYCISNYYKLLFNHIYFSCSFKDTGKSVDEVRPFLKTYKDDINKEDLLDIYFIVTVLFFIEKKYEDAISWCNKYADEKEFQAIRGDTIAISKVIRLLCHYELNNYDYLESLVVSTEKYIKANKFTNHLIITKYFRKILKSKSPASLQYIFKCFRAELSKAFPVNVHRQRLFNVNFVVNWVDSKLTNKDFSEILKLKLNEVISLGYKPD